MMRLMSHLTWSSVLILAVVACFAFPQTSSARDTREAAVRDALMKSASSFAQNDMAAATQVWATDESLTVFESGHANYGWADSATIIWGRRCAR